MSTLIIQRTNEFMNRFRKYTLYIDDRKVGKIAHGQKLTLDISPGTHTIYAKIDWCGSPKISFLAREGAASEFKIGSFKNSKAYLFIILALVMGNFISAEIFDISYLQYLFLPLLLGITILLIVGCNKYLTIKNISQIEGT